MLSEATINAAALIVPPLRVETILAVLEQMRKRQG
jgi:hypothetical protein